MCTYGTANFQTNYLKHTYFSYLALAGKVKDAAYAATNKGTTILY